MMGKSHRGREDGKTETDTRQTPGLQEDEEVQYLHLLTRNLEFDDVFGSAPVIITSGSDVNHTAERMREQMNVKIISCDEDYFRG